MMAVLKIKSGLDALMGSGQLPLLVLELLSRDWKVFADVPREIMPGEDSQAGCVEVGVAGPRSSRSANLIQKAGVRYPTYWSCRVSTPGELVGIVNQAQVTRELRLRAFAKQPSEELVTKWDVTQFWNAGSGLPEELAADLVIAFVQDLSAAVLLGNDAAVDEFRRVLKV
jgi:hypothetical protein